MDEEVKTFREDIAEIGTDVKLLLQRVEYITNKVDRHDAALYGNGKPGLISDVRELQERVKKSSGIWDKVIEYVLFFILAGIIVLLVQHGITP